MFRRLREGARELHLTVDGRHIAAREGDTVAAALLAAGVTPLRTTAASGAPRAPYCMSGACFECVVEIEGVGSAPACLVEARDGMAIRLVRGKRDPAR
jgi:predicted molibdopterin-dependent oxidoreductase YjgC